MERVLEILLLEDNADDVKLIELELMRGELPCRLQPVTSEKAFLNALKFYSPDLILTDYTLPGYNGIAAMKAAAELAPAVPIIMVTGSINEETAVECMKGGAADYILKPHLTRLTPAIRAALERKQARAEKELAEKAMRESERRFRNLADTAPVLIWMAGPDARFIYVNQPWLDFTGRKLDDELGNGWSECVHDEDVTACLNTHHQAFADRAVFQTEFRLRQANGEYRWILSHGVPRFMTGGVFAGYIGSCVDITERKQMERKLRESEARKSGILEAALDCIITIDHEGRIVEFNPAAEKAFGCLRGEVAGKKLGDLFVPPELREAHREGLAHCVQCGADGPLMDKRTEMTAVRADGTEFPIEVAITRVQTEGPPLFTGYLRDITQRKHHEHEREHLIHELQEALAKVKTLSGLLPICASCKKIRDDGGSWTQMEVYIRQRTDAEFTHGYCPDCARRFRESFEQLLPLK
jgi:PAS domain S-box-containing protein